MIPPNRMFPSNPMIPSNRMVPPSIARRCALAVGLLVCFALCGCNADDSLDPLQAIRQEQADGDFEGSIEPLRELLKTDPDDAELNFLYGRALSMTRGSNLAVWSLRKAMKDPEWLVPAASQLAFIGLVAGDFNEVIDVTGRILEREPENLKALLYRAQAYAHWKNAPEQAIADAKRVLELDPNAVEAYEPLIVALLDLERLDQAGKALAEAGLKVAALGTSEETLAWHCATTAVMQNVLEETERARETWIACLDTYPTDLDVVSSATGFYDFVGELDRSLEVLRAAFAGDPDSRVFRTMLAERLRVIGETAEAEALLREATSSDDPELAAAAWMDLGALHRALEAYGAAADALERALERVRETGTPDPQLLFEYADALVLAGRLDRALEVADDLSVPAQRHLIRARVAQERRDPARALDAFDEALHLWPDNPWARYYAALAAEELGDFRRALAEYRYAIRISVGSTDARTRGAAMLFAEGEPGLAIQMLRTGGDGEGSVEIEGQLLFMRLASLLGEIEAMSDQLALIEAGDPDWAGKALAEAAEGVAERSGPATALSMLATAPGVDYSEPRYAAALRALVRFSHEAEETATLQDTLQAILADHPDSGAFQEIRGLDLELSGAPLESVRAAYTQALELEPENARALESLGRLALADDPEAAIAYFDRAAAADPSDPDPKLQAARALAASGRSAEAARRLDELLVEHPFEAAAAAERARLDLERGVATPQTLERARRAVRFGRSADDLELLSRVQAERGEPELAARAAERASDLREARASESEASREADAQ